MLNLKDCDKAIEFYKKAFGAEEKSRMPGPDGKIMHAELQIGDSRIMMSEAMQMPATQSSIWLYVPDCDALFKRAVAAGAQVKMPLMDMFWGDRFGNVTDGFGNTWGIATHKEDVPPQEMEKRAKEAMATDEIAVFSPAPARNFFIRRFPHGTMAVSKSGAGAWRGLRDNFSASIEVATMKSTLALAFTSILAGCGGGSSGTDHDRRRHQRRHHRGHRRTTATTGGAAASTTAERPRHGHRRHDHRPTAPAAPPAAPPG